MGHHPMASSSPEQPDQAMLVLPREPSDEMQSSCLFYARKTHTRPTQDHCVGHRCQTIASYGGWAGLMRMRSIAVLIGRCSFCGSIVRIFVLRMFSSPSKKHYVAKEGFITSYSYSAAIIKYPAATVIQLACTMCIYERESSTLSVVRHAILWETTSGK